MDQLLIQRTRYVLRSRARRVQTCPDSLFVSACQHFYSWIENHPVLSSSVNYLRNVPGEYKEAIAKIILEAPLVESYNPGFYTAQSSEEHAAVCLMLVRAISSIVAVETLDQDENKLDTALGEMPSQVIVLKGKVELILRCLAEYLTANTYIKYDDALETLRDVAVDGLYEYLDEQVDARNAIFAIIQKYKQRSEWFHRTRLRQAAENGLEGEKGERALALDLQEYVLDQSVEFFVEPASTSGEVDLVLRDSNGRYLIIDAKYIAATASPSEMLRKIAEGFNQVSRYCDDFNEPEGFLVPFICSPTSIRLELEESDGLRFFMLGGKKIYYLSVNIADLPSASKSGKASEVTISAKDLIETISEF